MEQNEQIGTFSTPQINFVIQGSNDKPLLKLNHDGTVESTIDDATEAARLFVSHIGGLWAHAFNIACEEARQDERKRMLAELREAGFTNVAKFMETGKM
jgi:hypothetical protein